jgi:acylphosphatase
MTDAAVRWVFSGRVQGVGFRMTTLRLATGFDVRGWVRNLDDGTVEVVAGGDPAELDRFRLAIESEFRPNLSGVAVEQAATGVALPDGFAIRR